MIDHAELYSLFMNGRQPTPYAAGQVVFDEGADCDGMYIVGRGAVSLKHGERVIDTVTAPGLFGEIALIEDEPRTLTAVADVDSELYMIPPRHFWVLVHDTPHFAQLVMGVMAQRLRERGATT
jgi:CRP-like cAMP-binding protein